MTRAQVVLALLALAGCAPHEPPSSALVVRTAVDSARLACQLYRADMNIPRDEAVTEFCDQLRCKQP